MDYLIVGALGLLAILDNWCVRLNGVSLVERVASWLEGKRG